MNQFFVFNFNTLISILALIASVLSIVLLTIRRKEDQNASRRSKEAELAAINQNYFEDIFAYQDLPGKYEAKIRKEQLERELGHH